MSKSASRSGGQKRGRKLSRAVVKRQANDGAIYLGLVIIGVAITLLGLLLSAGEGSMAGWFAMAYIVLVAWLTNAAAIAVYRGRSLPPWRQALARLPLRFAGYGTKGGKPVEAAHDQPAAKTVIIASLVITVVLLVVLALFIVPEIRGG